jgi:phytanoyl-CoA hydroxylase
MGDFSNGIAQGLTDEQITSFNEDGYLIIPDALSQDKVSQLLAETHKMLDEFSLDNHPMTKFSTGDKSDHVGDDYFLSSGDKIRYFFEEGKHSGTVVILRSPGAHDGYGLNGCT